MLKAQLLALSSQSNPDKMKLLITFSGNYVNGTPDPLNLTPASPGNNATGFTNPKLLSLPEMPISLDVPPSIDATSLGGDYVQLVPLVAANPVVNGVAQGVAPNGGYGLRYYSADGTELASGPYPAEAIAAGAGVVIEVQLPQNQ